MAYAEPQWAKLNNCIIFLVGYGPPAIHTFSILINYPECNFTLNSTDKVSPFRKELNVKCGGAYGLPNTKRFQ